MPSEAVLRSEGMKLLIKGLGRVDAERFIASVISEPFDYTEWQRTLFEGMSVRELSDAAMHSYDSF
jgi:hypothetical protein